MKTIKTETIVEKNNLTDILGKKEIHIFAFNFRRERMKFSVMLARTLTWRGLMHRHRIYKS